MHELLSYCSFSTTNMAEIREQAKTNSQSRIPFPPSLSLSSPTHPEPFLCSASPLPVPPHQAVPPGPGARTGRAARCDWHIRPRPVQGPRTPRTASPPAGPTGAPPAPEWGAPRRGSKSAADLQKERGRGRENVWERGRENVCQREKQI